MAGRCAPAATQPPVRKTMQTLNPKEIGEGVTGMDTQQRQDRARSTTKIEQRKAKTKTKGTTKATTKS